MKDTPFGISLTEIRKAMKPAIRELENFTGMVRIVTHYDADGIAAAGIVVSALMKIGKRFRVSFVRGINSEVFENLSHEGFVIVLDMGSGQLDTINEVDGKFLILDHHITPILEKRMKERESNEKETGTDETLEKTVEFEKYLKSSSTNGSIYEFNTHSFGYDGTKEGCAATMAYIFSTAVSRMNTPTSALAISGMIGDKQLTPFIGLNSEVVKEGVNQGYISKKRSMLFLDGDTIRNALVSSTDPYFPGLTGRESKVDAFLGKCQLDGSKLIEELSLEERKILTDKLMLILLENDCPPEAIEEIVRTRYNLSEFGTYADTLANRLNACGRLGNMATGLAVCLGDRTSMEKSVELREKYRSTIRNGMLYLESRGIKKKKHIQYFFNNDPASSGAFASLGIQYLFNRHLPILALSRKNGQINISARGTKELVSKGLNLSEAMRDGGEAAGGHGGGHPIASGATVPRGKENEFIEHVDRIVGKQLSS